MNAHRQDMVNVELTVGEVSDAIERAILEKYKFLTEDSGWDVMDVGFDAKNLNACGPDANSKIGVTYFFTRDVEVEGLKEVCIGDCRNCLKECR